VLYHHLKTLRRQDRYKLAQQIATACGTLVSEETDAPHAASIAHAVSTIVRTGQTFQCQPFGEAAGAPTQLLIIEADLDRQMLPADPARRLRPHAHAGLVLKGRQPPCAADLRHPSR